MQVIKEVLDKLNSAYFELTRKIEEIDKEREAIKLDRLKLEEQEGTITSKTEELDKREGRVKEVESIVDFSNKAKALMKQAKELILNAEERQRMLDEGLQKMAADRTKLDAEIDAFNISQKKQIEAFQKEKKAFEEEKRSVKALQKIKKELTG